MKYEWVKANLGRRISLIIGSGNLRGELSDWGGRRIIILQKSLEIRNADINKYLPIISEGGSGKKNRRFRRNRAQIWRIRLRPRKGNLKQRMVKKRTRKRGFTGCRN